MNWTERINDLLAKGLTQAQVGALCGCSQPWVSARANATGDDCMRGVDWEVGDALLRAHRRICGPKRASKEAA